MDRVANYWEIAAEVQASPVGWGWVLAVQLERT